MADDDSDAAVDDAPEGGFFSEEFNPAVALVVASEIFAGFEG